MKNEGEFFYALLYQFNINADTGLAGGLLELARAGEPFEIYGVEPGHLPFCRKLSAACGCKYRSRRIHGECVAAFEPMFAGTLSPA